MPKICSGCHSVPTHQIFSIDNLFFPQHFQDPPIFFRKCKFFPLKFGDPPTYLRKTHIYLFFDPLTEDIFLYSKVYSVIFGFLMSFTVFFWVHKHVKSLKMIHFLSTFPRNDHNFSLMHHGKNVQDHGKNSQIGLFGTHQISIPSANFCLTPP